MTDSTDVLLRDSLLEDIYDATHLAMFDSISDAEARALERSAHLLCRTRAYRGQRKQARAARRLFRRVEALVPGLLDRLAATFESDSRAAAKAMTEPTTALPWEEALLAIE